MKPGTELKNKATGRKYIVLNIIGEEAILQPPWDDDRWPESFRLGVDKAEKDYEVVK